MSTREDIYKALDLEREIHKLTNKPATPLLQEEITLIDAYIQRAKKSVSYNDLLENLRISMGIAIRCFENYGIKQPKVPVTTDTIRKKIMR